MTETRRKLKKLFIIIIILSFITAIIWLLTRPEERTCFNGVKDVGEENIDCGGFCDKKCPPPNKPPTVQDISVEWVKAVKDGENNYDLVAKILNSNENWGVSSVDYGFNVYNKNGEIIDIVSDKSYVMPKGFLQSNNSRYIIENDFKTNEDIEKITIELYNFNWKEIKNIKELPELNMKVIRITKKKYEFIENEKEFFSAFGITENISKYGFNRVDINIVIFDSQGEVVAAGTTNQWTLSSGEGWEFKIFWIESFPKNIGLVDYEAQTNVFDIDNFMDVYGTGEKYVIPR